MKHEAVDVELAVVVLASVGRSAELIEASVRASELRVVQVADADELVARMNEGCGVCVVMEEDLRPPAAAERVVEVLREQPAWSELQVHVFAEDARSCRAWLRGRGLDRARGLVVTERPIDPPAMLSTIDVALRARTTQLQLRDAFVELSTKNEALCQRNRDLDQFGHTLVHDVRGPLATAQNGLELVEHLAHMGRTEELVEVVARCRRAIASVNRLADQLLVFARAGRRRLLPEELEELELVAVLDEVREELTSLLSERRARVLGPGRCRLRAHPVLLKQVLHNLVTNAIKYNDAPQPRVEVSVRRAPKAWRLSVRDNGRGIPEADAERLFEPFVRGKAGAGNGLGLATCRRVVQAHGGHIEARRNPEGGSTFSFSLPRVDSPTPAAADEA